MDSALEPGPLSPQEQEAVAEAAAWYAKYHARIIAERADDPSAHALAQRERYLDLLAGLEKLGYRIRNPLPSSDVVHQSDRQAA